MPFTSSCPKCQKQVLVPDGTCVDAVVRCPVCSEVYSLGEILAAVPALIVVHPGSSPAVAMETLATAAVVAPAAPAEGGVFSAHRVEPTLQDADPLLFEGDEVQLATPEYGHVEPFGHSDGEQLGEAVLFEAGPAHSAETDQPVEVIAEPIEEVLAVPMVEDGHPAIEENHVPAAEGPATGSADEAPWGGEWIGFKDETPHEEGGHATAEADQDAGLEHVDFAAITGKAAPGSTAAVGEAIAAEPVKKKRKRETSMLGRLIGMAVAGLLALVCVFGIASWRGIKMDFLPSWLQFNFNKSNTRVEAPKPGPQPVALANPQASSSVQTPANVQPPTAGSGQPAVIPATADSSKKPDADKTEAGSTKTEPAPGKPAAADSGKAPAVATNDPGKKPVKPAAPAATKSNDDPGPFDEGPSSKPETSGPKGQGGSKPEANPFGPAAPDAGPFAAPPDVSSLPKTKPDDKAGKPDVTPPGKKEPVAKPGEEPFGPTDVKPATEKKPEVSPPNKTAPAAKPDEEPFGPTEVKPAKENNPAKKPEVKTEMKPALLPPNKVEPAAKPDEEPFGPSDVKPATENKPAKPESRTDKKPEISPPDKTAPAAKPDEEPFGPGPAVPPAPEKAPEKSVPDKSADAKPEVPVPAKPEKADVGTKPPAKIPDVKPDATPPIGPEPKTSQPKTEVKPPVKPVSPVPATIVPKTEPTGVHPLSAPTFSSADVDAPLKTVTGAATVDAASYANWCTLAEVLTYAKDASDAQKQALRALTEKVASNPQSVAAIDAAAKTLLDSKVAKGGIVLTGTVSGQATKNGLYGTAIRMGGMGVKPVMVFSAHPLNVKEAQKVVVLGALVGDPKKNLPGYPGTQPVVVWSDFTTAIP